MDKIILIGGAPAVGKSSAAEKIAKDLKLPWISTDIIRGMMRPIVNKKDYLIPMAIEESSVLAAASNAAKIARVKGGFTADCSASVMIGQIQVLYIKNMKHTQILKFIEKAVGV